MTIGSIMKMLVITALVFTGIIVFLGGVQNAYNFEVDGNYSMVYNDINSQVYSNGSSLYNMREELSDSLNKTTGENPVLGFVDSMFSIGMSAIKGTIGTTGIASGMANAIATMIPGLSENMFIIDGILFLIVLTIGLILVGLLVGRKLK